MESVREPALTGNGAAQGQKRKKPASVACGLDVDCGEIPGAALLPPKKPAILSNAGDAI